MTRTIYHDIPGLDAESMHAKAELVLTLERAIVARGWTLASAADALGLKPTDLELVLGGRFRDIAPETILLWLRIVGFRMSVSIETPTSWGDAPGAINIQVPAH